MNYKKTSKTIKRKKLLEVYDELTKGNVTVKYISYKVLEDGSVEVVECEYEETTPEQQS